MTPQDKINLIRQVVIKSNQSIMDLVFGCEVKLKLGLNQIILTQESPNSYLCIQKNGKAKGQRKIDITKSKDFEILGRPIRLADVMLAYTKKAGFPCIEMAQICSAWDLYRDDLNFQQEICLDFLYHLLIQGE